MYHCKSHRLCNEQMYGSVYNYGYSKDAYAVSHLAITDVMENIFFKYIVGLEY